MLAPASNPAAELLLTDFSTRRPAYRTPQDVALDWLHGAFSAADDSLNAEQTQHAVVRLRKVLNDAQVQTSRDVLFDHGNTSSATLPHVWKRLVEERGVAPGALVPSLAFGPGLTMCGELFRKHGKIG